MHPLLAWGVAGVVFVALMGYALMMKPLYQADSVVYLEPLLPKLLSDGSPAIFDPSRYDAFLSEQMQLMQRRDVLTTAIAALPNSTWNELGPSPQAATNVLQEQLKVQRIGTSYQVSISLKGTDPAKTAAVVNAVTTAYLGAVHKATTTESDERAQLLAEEQARIQRELQTARAEQTALGARIGVSNLTVEGGNPYDSQLTAIRTQLTEARAAHDVAAAQLASLSGVGPSHSSGLTDSADELIAGDPGLSSMKASVSQRKAALNSQMAGMTPNNPIYKQDQAEIADLDHTIDVMANDLRARAARHIQDKLRTDLERTGDIEARLNGELSQQIASATSASPKLQRASEVASDIQRLNIRQAAVDDALRGLRLDSNGPGQVHLSLAASAPEHPDPSRKKLLLLLALPMAMFLGAGAAVLARKQDKRIYSGLDVDEVLGFAPLTVLPARRDVTEGIFDEYVLRLAAGVESAYRTNGARTFLLTAVSLTTDIAPLATALKRKFQEIGVNVVVATTSEMLTPTEGVLSTTHEEQRKPGELSRVVELWSEGFVAANMARMKAEHGLVLIESEALLNCGQTEYVARCADATILLIECGVTTREELLSAAELLERLNVTGIGAVLEELQLRFADAGFKRAIQALGRRQSEAMRQHTRPVSQPVHTVPVADAKLPMVAEVRPTAQEPEPQPVYEPMHVHEAVHMPDAVHLQEQEQMKPLLDLLNLEHERAEQYRSEPAQIPETHVPEAQVPEIHKREIHEHAVEETIQAETIQTEVAPTEAARTETAEELTPIDAAEVDEELVVPPAHAETVEEEPQPEPVSEETTRRVSTNVTAGPMLVTEPLPPRSVREEIAEEPMVALATGTLHEKVAPTLSGRMAESRSGDGTMPRKMSWLDRLLGRDPEPGYSMVPAEVEEDELGQESDVETANTTDAPEIQTQYDLPLVARLEQISGSRQVAPSHLSSNSNRTRLQIVPHEKVYEETDSPDEDLFETAEIPVEEHSAVPQEIASVAFEPEPQPLEPETAPIEIEPMVSRGPRHPFSFHELREKKDLVTTAPAGEAEPQRTIEEPEAVHAATQETVWEMPVAESQAAVEEESPVSVVEEAPVYVVDEVSVYVAEEVYETRETAAEVQAERMEQVEAPTEYAHAVEPAAQPLGEPFAEATVSPVIEPLGEPVAEEIAAEAAASERAENPERDDVKPAYEEESRHLQSRRWDPIPPLRSSGIAWRVTPSTSATDASAGSGDSDAARRRWTGAAEDELGAIDGWGREPVRQHTESLPAPLLTRQWGLLSRFQQARFSSISRVATIEPADADQEPEAVGPGSSNGSGHRQS